MNHFYFAEENISDLSELYERRYYQTKEYETVVVKNGVILPPRAIEERAGLVDAGVIDAEENFVTVSSQYYKKYKHASVIQNHPHINKRVIYCGILNLHYGHFLIESTERLYYGINNMDAGVCLCFSAFSQDIPKFASDFFELLGITPEKLILITEETSFDEIIIPGLSYFCRTYYTENFVLPFRKAAENIAPAPYEKIFFSRKNWQGMAKCLGEEVLEEVFNKNGFHSVAMEKLSLREQIAVIKGAKVLAGINGTAFHNILFAEDSKQLIMLNRNAETDCQYIINEAAKAECFLIQAFSNPLPVSHANGPFIVGLTKYVKQFLHDHNMSDFGLSFNPLRYAKDFYKLYCNYYNRQELYEELQFRHIELVDIADVLQLVNLVSDNFWHRINTYLKSKLTFGKTRKKYKAAWKEYKKNKSKEIIFRY